MSKKNIIISLGGSIVVPDDIDTNYVKKFKQLILQNLKKYNFIIIVGGGKYARKYQEAGKKLNVKTEKLDWLGIGISQNNAWFINYVFDAKTPEKIHLHPEKVNFSKPIQVAGGWKPGWSTDYVATQFAVKNNIDTVINLSNIDYVYVKDPNKYISAKKKKELNWADFQKIVGTKWKPGMNAPFDPIATKIAKANNLTVVCMNGKKLANISSFLRKKPFIGTTIKS